MSRVPPKYSLRRLTAKDEDEAMKLLKTTINCSSESWVWKYKLNPDFNPSFGAVVVNNEKFVGCAYWLPRHLKIFNSAAVGAVLGADLAVQPEHRGRGLSRALISFEDKILEKSDILISYGLVDPKLVERVHGPTLGLVNITTSTSVYRKYFDCSVIRKQVSSLNKIIESDRKQRAKLAEMNVGILFRLTGFPPFLIKIGPDRIYVKEDSLSNPAPAHLKIEGDTGVLVSFIKDRAKIINLIKALLTGKIKISGNILRAARALFFLSRLRQAFK